MILKILLLVVLLVVLLGVMLIDRLRRPNPVCRIAQNQAAQWVLILENRASASLALDPGSKAEILVDQHIRETVQIAGKQLAPHDSQVYEITSLDPLWLRQTITSKTKTEVWTHLAGAYDAKHTVNVSFRHKFDVDLRRFEAVKIFEKQSR